MKFQEYDRNGSLILPQNQRRQLHAIVRNSSRSRSSKDAIIMREKKAKWSAGSGVLDDPMLQQRHKLLNDLAKTLFWCLLLACAVYSVAFVHRFSIKLGGQTYNTEVSQPWFRFPHYEHERVVASEKEDSNFGHHFIPPEDMFLPPQWSPPEERYLPCMNRTCVCGFFNGRVLNGECLLPNNVTMKKARRTELRMLSDEKRIEFEQTLNWLKKIGMYNRLMRIHKYAGVHNGPAFAIWHREFLKRIELVLRFYLPDKNMGVPYWDSTLDSMLPEPKHSIMFSEIFLGDIDNEGHVVTGPYKNWETMEGDPFIFRTFNGSGGEVLTNARVDWLINNDDYNMILGAALPLTTCSLHYPLDARMYEYSHNYVHFFIGGHMEGSASSSNDVVFIYHHSMMDLVLELFRQNKQTREERETQYPPSDPNCYPKWHFAEEIMPMLYPLKNKDALSNGYTDELYEFDARPSCTKAVPDCGSKYLFCHLNSDDVYCMSKVRAHGICTGFEGTEICYKGECVEGICRPKSGSGEGTKTDPFGTSSEPGIGLKPTNVKDTLGEPSMNENPKTSRGEESLDGNQKTFMTKYKKNVIKEETAAGKQKSLLGPLADMLYRFM